MSGVVLLLAGIGLGVVVLWSIANDKVPLRGPTTGWLAMRDDGPEEDLQAQSAHRSKPVVRLACIQRDCETHRSTRAATPMQAIAIECW